MPGKTGEGPFRESYSLEARLNDLEAKHRALDHDVDELNRFMFPINEDPLPLRAQNAYNMANRTARFFTVLFIVLLGTVISDSCSVEDESTPAPAPAAVHPDDAAQRHALTIQQDHELCDRAC